MNSFNLSVSLSITSIASSAIQQKQRQHLKRCSLNHCNWRSVGITERLFLRETPKPISCNERILSCLSSSSSSSSSSSPMPVDPKTRLDPPTKLFVSGLSFRTTEESLRNAFKGFGQLVEVNLVMDKIANRPRGFAFIRYAKEEESKKAIEGMHGKFLDGRVIFVETAKPRNELRQNSKENSRQ